MMSVDRLIAAAGTEETAEDALPGYAGCHSVSRHRRDLRVLEGSTAQQGVAKAVADVDLEVTVINDAPYSAAELDKASTKVWTDRPYWETQGVHVESWAASGWGMAVCRH